MYYEKRDLISDLPQTQSLCVAPWEQESSLSLYCWTPQQLQQVYAQQVFEWMNEWMAFLPPTLQGASLEPRNTETAARNNLSHLADLQK